ncbi:cilia- and flagella- associated protein 210-like [Clytia hemisphaerica]
MTTFENTFLTTEEEYEHQPDHDDVEVAAGKITKWVEGDLRLKNDIKRNEHLRTLLKKYQEELKALMIQDDSKYRKEIKMEKKYQEKKMNRLMVHEAKQVESRSWDFEKSDPRVEDLVKKIKEFKLHFDKDRSQAKKRMITGHKEASRLKLKCVQEQNKHVLKYLDRDWQRKIEDSWRRIESQLLYMHEKEVKEKNEKEEKIRQNKLNARQNELQPSLDLRLNARREIIDENQQLLQDVTALRIKHSTAADLLFKLKSTFELFIGETKQADAIEANKLATQLIDCKKTSFIEVDNND